MTTEIQVNGYLARLRASLTGMTVAEREDIVEEIKMHIRERSGDPGTNVETVLAGLGLSHLTTAPGGSGRWTRAHGLACFHPAFSCAASSFTSPAFSGNPGRAFSRTGPMPATVSRGGLRRAASNWRTG